MFSYICLGSNDLPRASGFYDAVLAAVCRQPQKTAPSATSDSGGE